MLEQGQTVLCICLVTDILGSAITSRVWSRFLPVALKVQELTIASCGLVFLEGKCDKQWDIWLWHLVDTWLVIQYILHGLCAWSALSCALLCLGTDQFNIPCWVISWEVFIEGRQGCYTGTRHYDDVIMSAMASEITSLTIVYSTVYSGADEREHQSSAPLAFVRGSDRWPVNSLHKGPVTRKRFPFDDVIMVDLSTNKAKQNCVYISWHI